MEKKINIVELLKDCPKGMELDCALYDKVTLLSVDDREHAIFPIKVSREDGNIISLTKYGQYTGADFAKCIIFPKGKTTWEGFVPPCKFKDGDVISNLLGTCIFKGEGRIKGTVDYYCGVVHTNYFNVKDKKSNPDKHYGNIVEYRFATEEEKQKLFNVIKDNGYKWNEEAKTLEKLIKPKFKVGDIIKYIYFDRKVAKVVKIHNNKYELDNGKFLEFQDENAYEISYDKFDITTLKPFDKVLVRDSGKKYWSINFFGFYNEITEQFHCMGNTEIGWNECIPYEDNECLLGTTNNCNEYYKTW